MFLCTGPDGEISPAPVTGEGLYFNDTRYLSELRLLVNGTQPVLLSSSDELRYSAVVDATNADLQLGHLAVPQQTINVQRLMAIRDRLFVRIRLRNFGLDSIEVDVRLLLGADFADMFEVRGKRRRTRRGLMLDPSRTDEGVTLGYVGRDEVRRETTIALDPPPGRLELLAKQVRASWPVELPPGKSKTLLATIGPSEGGRTRRRLKMDTALEQTEREHRSWKDACTRIETDNEVFDRLVRASIGDLKALMMPAPDPQRPGEPILAAGIPWYVALFGRDSLLTCYESLMLNTDIARRTLLLLARLQARTDDPWRDAEPGKIPHEVRSGELAGAGLIPHTPYYGTADATPLFLMLAAAYYRWTADLETMTALRPALDTALNWIDEHGDRDGDGFVEYKRRSRGGLRNQGWKDSEDCIVHADGSLAEPPIALVEVQGYVYLAKLRIADVYERLGDLSRAAELHRQAEDLKSAFNEAFWNPEEGFFALALDGRKQQVRSVSSNPGHCLYCGIVDSDKATATAERLMAPDMFCGWGVRTLSSDSPAYNPMSYHKGSVWPHDNAIVAAGLKRYGFDAEVQRIMSALFDVASGSRDFRLPELYCGFDRSEMNIPVAYPVACSPQAWATAVPFMLLQANLGISPHASEGTLNVNQPQLPEWIRHLELDGMRVGDSSISLAFYRDGDVTGFVVREQRGSVKTVIRG